MVIYYLTHSTSSYSVTHSHIHPHIHSHIHSPERNTHAHSLTNYPTHSLIHPPTYPLTHSPTHKVTLYIYIERERIRTMWRTYYTRRPCAVIQYGQFAEHLPRPDGAEFLVIFQNVNFPIWNTTMYSKVTVSIRSKCRADSIAPGSRGIKYCKLTWNSFTSTSV